MQTHVSMWGSELPLEGPSEPDATNGIMTYVADESFTKS